MRLTKKINLLLEAWARWAGGPRGIDKNALYMPIHVCHNGPFSLRGGRTGGHGHLITRASVHSSPHITRAQVAQVEVYKGMRRWCTVHSVHRVGGALIICPKQKWSNLTKNATKIFPYSKRQKVKHAYNFN